MSYKAAVITVSDKGALGERPDTSGPAICKTLESKGWNIVYTSIIPDEKDKIKAELTKCADELKINLVLTTGGTGFSPRDITPEATLEVIERRTAGIPEAMRAESLKITPKGCLSRSEAGIRKKTLIINLPGSKKAANENLMAIIDPIEHGIEMLLGEGSADCGEPHQNQRKEIPSMDEWLREAKADPSANKVGMYLTHNGVVRQTAKAKVRDGHKNTALVSGMLFSYNKEKVDAAVTDTYKMDGIYYVRIWLNEGKLNVGDDIMFILIGGDIRPNVVNALQYLVGRIKSKCVAERELYIG
jgi:molybdopterin adenylyltransferase